MTPSCFLPALSTDTSLPSQTEAVYEAGVGRLCAVPVGNTMSVPRQRAAATPLRHSQWLAFYCECRCPFPCVGDSRGAGLNPDYTFFFGLFLRIDFSPAIVISASCRPVQYSKNFLPSSRMMYANMFLTTVCFPLNIQKGVKLKGMNKDNKAL